MRLKDAQALVDRCFDGVAEGAARLYEPGDPRFADRPSAVWLEYRWYVLERGLAEVFLKWGRVSPEQSPDTEVSVIRVHLLGDSPGLAARAQGLIQGGTPSPERILGLFGDDGVGRDCVSFGSTSVTVEQWARRGPRELLDEPQFQELAQVLAEPVHGAQLEHLDGGVAAPEHAGDLGAGQPGQAKLDRAPLVRGQHGDDGGQRSLLVGRQGDLLGRRRRVGVLARRLQRLVGSSRA